MSSKREQDRRKAEAAMLYMQAYYEWTSGKRSKASLDALSEELERAVSGLNHNK
tara:strand:- start:382 stop:543 length:162 start_codon:yes stop_codon:yes gene_type:complete